MLAEQLVRTGSKLISAYPPEGRDYWAARFWDRNSAEQDPIIGEHYRSAKKSIADMIKRYGANANQTIEFACGTGEFTNLTAKLTPASEIVALDISAQGLERTAKRVQHDGLRLIQGDFWADHQLGQAPLVLCIDAIHHIGNVKDVLTRMKQFVAPGGVFIGNLWTVDHFHDLQRQRYGNLNHSMRSAMFFTTAVLIRASNGRLRTASYRTQLVSSKDIPALLDEVFSETLEIHPDDFFVGFACRP